MLMRNYLVLLLLFLTSLPLEGVFIISPDFPQQMAQTAAPQSIPVPVMLGSKIDHITASVACMVCSCVFQHYALQWLKKKGWMKKEREIDWRTLIMTKILQATVNYYQNFIAPPEPLNYANQQWLLWAYGAEPPSPLLELVVRGTTLAWFAVRAIAELYAYTRKNPRSFLLSRPWETKQYIWGDLFIFAPLTCIAGLVHEFGHWFCAEIIAPEIEPSISSFYETSFKNNPTDRWQNLIISSAGGLFGGIINLLSALLFLRLSHGICKKKSKEIIHQKIQSTEDKKILQQLAHFIAKKTAFSLLYLSVINFDHAFSPLPCWFENQINSFFTSDCGIIYNLLKITPSPLFGF